MKYLKGMKYAVFMLGLMVPTGTAFQRGVEHAECADASQGDLGGWSVKNVCNGPIDLGLAWRQQGTGSPWSFKLTRGLTPGFQIDTPNCMRCVFDLQLRAFLSRDRVSNEELRPYTRN